MATTRIRRRLDSVLPRGEFGRGVLTLVAGTGTAQVIVIASSPILTRLYLPADYGVYSVATSILAVLVTITCLRYEFAVPLPETDVMAANVLALSLLSAVTLSLATAVALMMIGHNLLSVFGASVLAPYIPLMALGQLGAGIVSALTNWAVRTKTFYEIAATRMTQSIALVGAQIGLGAVALGAPGLFIGDVAGRITGSSRLARAAWRYHASSFRLVSWSGIVQAATRYRRFPIFSSWSALLAALGLQVPLLALVALYGATVGGEYALAARVCAAPLTLVAGSVGQVFVADAARLVHTQPAAIQRLFGRTTGWLARSSVGPAIILGIAAPFLAEPVFGHGWREAGLFVAILTASYFLEFVMTATGDVLYVIERQDLQLAREVVRCGLIAGAVPLAAMLHLSPVWSIVLLSAARCVTYVLYGGVSWYAIRGRVREALALPTPGPDPISGPPPTVV